MSRKFTYIKRERSTYILLFPLVHQHLPQENKSELPEKYYQ